MINPPEGVIGKTLTFTDKIRYNVKLTEGNPDEDIIIYNEDCSCSTLL